MLENITVKELVKDASKYEDRQFRYKLQSLIREGSSEVENELNQIVLSDSIDERIRINIIYSMGYVPRISFLPTLQKILEGKESIIVYKTAIISLSKYFTVLSKCRDKRALDIFNTALDRIDDPSLIDSISTEISQIKDNPILGLRLYFINWRSKDNRHYLSKLILKKILLPSDAQRFTEDLQHNSSIMSNPSFELLCLRGDDRVQSPIFEYVRSNLKTVWRMYGDEHEVWKSGSDLLPYLENLEIYITRNPHTLKDHISTYKDRYSLLRDLKKLYKKTTDNKVKNILANILSISQNGE